MHKSRGRAPFLSWIETFCYFLCFSDYGSFFWFCFLFDERERGGSSGVPQQQVGLMETRRSSKERSGVERERESFVFSVFLLRLFGRDLLPFRCFSCTLAEHVCPPNFQRVFWRENGITHSLFCDSTAEAYKILDRIILLEYLISLLIS